MRGDTKDQSGRRGSEKEDGENGGRRGRGEEEEDGETQAVSYLQHDDVLVKHDLLAIVELVVDDLVDHRVAIALPHPSQHLDRHYNHL